MPYGFVLAPGFGAPLLEKTYTGEGEGKRVVEINGESTLGKARSEIRETLNQLAQTQAAVVFVLESGNTVTFHHDGAPRDWYTPASVE